MDAKLTLKLDKSVIDEAKKYASSHKRSLSRIIESYLKSLSIREKDESLEKVQISEFVQEMSSGSSLPLNLDYKSEYTNYLTDKHK